MITLNENEEVNMSIAVKGDLDKNFVLWLLVYVSSLYQILRK